MPGIQWAPTSGSRCSLSLCSLSSSSSSLSSLLSLQDSNGGAVAAGSRMPGWQAYTSGLSFLPKQAVAKDRQCWPAMPGWAARPSAHGHRMQATAPSTSPSRGVREGRAGSEGHRPSLLSGKHYCQEIPPPPCSPGLGGGKGSRGTQLLSTPAVGRPCQQGLGRHGFGAGSFQCRSRFFNDWRGL